MANSKTVKVTDADFDATISEGLVLVDFWAPWCGPCQIIGPILDEVSEEMEGKVTIAKLNVDENQATPQKYGVQGIPTMILFKNGQLVDRIVGARPKASVIEFSEQLRWQVWVKMFSIL